MTLILNTGGRASGALRNALPLGLPDDAAAAMFFDRDTYRLGNTPCDIGDLLSVARAVGASDVQAEHHTLMGAQRLVGANLPRVGRGSGGGMGLIVESERENLFRDSGAPMSHSLTVTFNRQALILSCEGGGSISVSGAIEALPGSTLTASPGSPAVFKFSEEVSTVLTFTVIGQPTHAQLERGGQGVALPTSRIHNTGLAPLRRRRADLVSATPAMLAALAGDWTVILTLADVVVPAAFYHALEYRAILGAGTEAGHIGVVWAAGGDGSRIVRARTNFGIEKVRSITLGQGRSDVICLAKTGASLRLAVNGQLATIPEAGLTGWTPPVLNLGYSYPWVNVSAMLNAVITRAMVYSRALSSDDLIRISRSG